MATEEGYVFKITPNNTAWVRTQRMKTCDHCESRDDCQTMGSKLEDMEVELPNLVGADVGDRVILSMPTGSLLYLSFLMYVAPIITMIVGGILGQELARYYQMDETGFSVLFSMLFFVLAILSIRIYSNVMAKNDKYKPRLTRILGPSTNAPVDQCIA
ncbi:MAG: ositive regulator of sigma E, RseC/MucC [Candidatus Magnetoglobus multicellularis str. Araruama]|uniref:Ositive regulator of sigma E, RseC/MucC n=1 Tax=Candidatus Magnetoglobus multicellularis str. Araruama TaxID=890399 RepID=A0A1V1PAN2_9BACT|nr:MAG: ositive regulator of sigma E, RseC/MucC [Candidatus Magnetoglobus multicellularis str. Araruama]